MLQYIHLRQHKLPEAIMYRVLVCDDEKDIVSAVETKLEETVNQFLINFPK